MHPIKESMDTLQETLLDLKKKSAQQLTQLDSKLEKHLLALQRPQTLSAPSGSISPQDIDPAFKAFLQGTMGSLQKSLTTTTPERGGALIPPVIEDRILVHVTTLSPLRAEAHLISIASSSLDVLVNTKDPEVGWVAEEEERPATEEPELTKMTIPVHEMYAKPRATQKLLDDASIHVENWLVQKVGERMARMETLAFLNGNGEKKPRGLLSYELIDKSAWRWGKIEAIQGGNIADFLTPKGADLLIEALQTLKPIYLKGAIWLMSPSALAAIRKLKDFTTGQYLWQPGLGSTPQTLLGQRILVIEEMPPFYTDQPTSPIILVNLKEAYQIVDRTGMHILRDPYSAKPYVEFYVTRRVGGDVVNFEAVKVLHFNA